MRRFDEALEALSIAARIDLDDLTGTTAGGVHSRRWAALGRRSRSLSGVRPRGDRLIVDPRLPPQWHSLQLALRFRGEPFRLSIDRLGAEIESDGLAIRRANGIWEVCEK